jgi:hypothetical protein
MELGFLGGVGERAEVVGGPAANFVVSRIDNPTIIVWNSLSLSRQEF